MINQILTRVSLQVLAQLSSSMERGLMDEVPSWIDGPKMHEQIVK